MDSDLLKNRIIILNGEVNENSAMEVIKKLLYLDSKNNNDINLYINSPGGSVIDGLAIIDCMNYVKSDVATVCIGSAYSMGAVILASGAKGKRYALPNSEVMIHDVKGGTYGDVFDMNIRADRMERHRDIIVEIFKKATSKTKKEIELAIKKDKFMDSNEALKYGLVDKVIFHHKG